jgi:hypothetical protein
MKKILTVIMVISILSSFSIACMSQEKAKPAEKPVAAASTEKAVPAMSAEQKAAMEKMIAAGTPGEPHKFIAKFEGTWKAVVKMWETPGSEPQVSEGVSVNKLIFGGRYLIQNFKSSFMDQPFEGMGLLAYDNIMKKFVGTWIDSMSTQVSISEGKLSKDGKTLENTNTFSDCQLGTQKKTRDVMVMESPDKFVSKMYDKTKDGKEFLMMEITYTKEKK